MRDESSKGLKAWAKQYEETAFFFEETSEHGTRLVAWTENPEQAEKTFYALLNQLPEEVNVLLKICINRGPSGETGWSRFHGTLGRATFAEAVRKNETYVFTDGMHVLCAKDPDSDRCLAFDDHSVFFVYQHMLADMELLKSLGFEQRTAELIYSTPHFQVTPPGSEALEMQFITDLDLEKVQSDAD